MLDHKLAKECLVGQGGTGDLAPELSEVLTLGQQISRVLTDGTKGNPRQIKRFLNSMLVRNEVATARGLGAHIKKPILAKIMLAEAFNPTFYDQLTRATYADRDGQPKELTALEQSVRVQVAAEKKTNGAEVKVEAPKDGDEWAKSDWVATWAKCDPPLSGIDLRPYVFVTRDKRSYFGGAAGTSHLDHIVDALLGKELAVKSVESQLTKLGLLDAEQVFEAVQSRIVQGDDFSGRPFGLIALAKAHTSLQRRLLDFIKAIPAAKLPGWVATGFEKVFTESAVKEEYNQTCLQREQGGESKQFTAARQMAAGKGKKA